MKLLLADDDSDQLELRALTLGKAGHELSTATNLAAALQLAASENPDVAVVDLRFPTQELGLQLIRELRRLNPLLRIVVLTGADPKHFETLPERAWVEAVFTKGGAARQLAAYLRESAGFPLRKELAAKGELTLDVKVIPKSSKSEIEFLRDGGLKVKLAAVAEKGKANQELIGLLAAYFHVRKEAVAIVTGETSQHKCVRIRPAT